MAYLKTKIAMAMALLAVPAVAQAAPSADQAKKYCIRFASDTGSRINRVECRTRAEWAKLGVDVDNLKD